VNSEQIEDTMAMLSQMKKLVMISCARILANAGFSCFQVLFNHQKAICKGNAV